MIVDLRVKLQGTSLIHRSTYLSSPRNILKEKDLLAFAILKGKNFFFPLRVVPMEKGFTYLGITEWEIQVLCLGSMNNEKPPSAAFCI